MNAESALPGSELSEYQAGESSLLGTKALPLPLCARVLLRALGRVLTTAAATAEPGTGQLTRVIVSGFPRNKHAAIALRAAVRSASETASDADGAADGATGRLRALCLRSYGSASEPRGDTTLEQLVAHLREHGTLVEVDGRGDAVTVQSRMHAALVEVDPASHPAAFLKRAGVTAQLLLAEPGAEAEAEAEALCTQLCAEEPPICYIALPLALARRGEGGEAAGSVEAGGGAALMVATQLLRSMALAAEAARAAGGSAAARLRFLLHGVLPATAEAEAAVVIEALQLVAVSVGLRGLLMLGGGSGGEGGGVAKAAAVWRRPLQAALCHCSCPRCSACR